MTCEDEWKLDRLVGIRLQWSLRGRRDINLIPNSATMAPTSNSQWFLRKRHGLNRLKTDCIENGLEETANGTKNRSNVDGMMNEQTMKVESGEKL